MLKVIVLINSLAALTISATASIYVNIQTKKSKKIIYKYYNKLKEMQIKQNKLYNFIRLKRNKAMEDKVKFQNGKISPRRFLSACQEEKVLREIEEFIQENGILNFND